jgi:hypothetical protein
VHCENSFQELKKKLMSAPILISTNPSESFVVYYDASKMGLGGVLMQNGQCHTPILSVHFKIFINLISFSILISYRA